MTFNGRPANLGYGLDLPAQLARVKKELEKRIRSEGAEARPLRLSDLSDESREALVSSFGTVLSALGKDLQSDLLRYFSCEEPADLVRRGARAGPLTVQMDRADGLSSIVTLRINPDGGETSVAWSLPDLNAMAISPETMRWFLAAIGDNPPPGLLWRVVLPIWLEAMAATVMTPKNAYHLPAARSGVLETRQLLASTAVQALSSRVDG